MQHGPKKVFSLSSFITKSIDFNTYTLLVEIGLIMAAKPQFFLFWPHCTFEIFEAYVD